MVRGDEGLDRAQSGIHGEHIYIQATQVAVGMLVRVSVPFPGRHQEAVEPLPPVWALGPDRGIMAPTLKLWAAASPLVNAMLAVIARMARICLKVSPSSSRSRPSGGGLDAVAGRCLVCAATQTRTKPEGNA